MSNLDIAVALLAVWVFLSNITYVSSTVGWVIGLAAFLLVVIPYVRSR